MLNASKCKPLQNVAKHYVSCYAVRSWTHQKLGPWHCINIVLSWQERGPCCKLIQAPETNGKTHCINSSFMSKPLQVLKLISKGLDKGYGHQEKEHKNIGHKKDCSLSSWVMKVSRNLVTASPWYILNRLSTSSHSHLYQTRFHVCSAFCHVLSGSNASTNLQWQKHDKSSSQRTWRASAPPSDKNDRSSSAWHGATVCCWKIYKHRRHPTKKSLVDAGGKMSGGHWWNHREQVRCHPFFQHEPACQKLVR